jgi:DNA primase
MLELKKKLRNNPQQIKNILKIYQFHNIDVREKEIRCGIDEDGNATSIRIKLNENLTANDFARDIHGDLFSIIMKCKNVDLKNIIQVVKGELGVSYIEFNKGKKIFGGFYENIKLRNKGIIELKTYDEDCIKDFVNKYNTLFLRDGINFSTQRKFRTGVCHHSSRITVPWFSFEGDIIGIEGRYMGDHKKDETPKWYPLIPFPKSQSLFGYHTNYTYLQGAEEIYVGESSKFTMQLDSMDIFTGVALGGNSIHTQQIKMLSWLNPKKIIFCFDEGLDKSIIINQINKTKILLRFSDIQVGYVLDKHNEILKKDSKNSPSDVGIEGFNELIRNHVEWG